MRRAEMGGLLPAPAAIPVSAIPRYGAARSLGLLTEKGPRPGGALAKMSPSLILWPMYRRAPAVSPFRAPYRNDKGCTL